jgi:hypothetical protein
VKPPALADLDTARQAAVLNHGEQRTNFVVVSKLLRLMDNAGRDPGLLFEMQKRLFHALYRAQLAAGDIRRVRKRIADGKHPDWQGAHSAEVLEYVQPSWKLRCAPDSVDPNEWELEAAVATRVARQLGDIGDGLAWRIYRHDRGLMIALADHTPISPIVADSKQSGLASEVGAVVAAFRDRGTFALLHDLTTVLRHTDLTELHADGYRELHEVKASSTRGSVSKASKQRHAATAALNAAAGTQDLNLSDVRIARVSTQLRTHVRRLEDVLALATANGHVVARVSDRVVGAWCHPSVVRSGLDADDMLRKFTVEVEKMARRVTSSDYRLQASLTLQDCDRPSFCVPFSVWPLPSEQRAALICDHIQIVTIMDCEAVRYHLQTASGARVCYNQNADEVFTIFEARTRRTIHASAIRQLLAEFIVTGCFAAGVVEAVSQHRHRKRYVHVFANERACWR